VLPIVPEVQLAGFSPTLSKVVLGWFFANTSRGRVGLANVSEPDGLKRIVNQGALA